MFIVSLEATRVGWVLANPIVRYFNKFVIFKNFVKLEHAKTYLLLLSADDDVGCVDEIDFTEKSYFSIFRDRIFSFVKPISRIFLKIMDTKLTCCWWRWCGLCWWGCREPRVWFPLLWTTPPLFTSPAVVVKPQIQITKKFQLTISGSSSGSRGVVVELLGKKCPLTVLLGTNFKQKQTRHLFFCFFVKLAVSS